MAGFRSQRAWFLLGGSPRMRRWPEDHGPAGPGRSGQGNRGSRSDEVIPQRAVGESPDQDRGHARAGVERSGDPGPDGRGRGRRLPAQLLAWHARGAHGEAPGDPSDRGRHGDPGRDLAGPVRPEDPAGGDPWRRGLLRPRCGVRPGRRARHGRPPPADLLASDAAGRPGGRPAGAVRRRHGGDGGRRAAGQPGPAQGHAAGIDPVAPGDQRPRRGAERLADDGEGHRRPGMDLDARRGLRRAVVRAPGGGRRRPAPRAGASRQPRADRGQDREAQGADQPRRDHRRGRRGDGRARETWGSSWT